MNCFLISSVLDFSTKYKENNTNNEIDNLRQRKNKDARNDSSYNEDEEGDENHEQNLNKEENINENNENQDIEKPDVEGRIDPFLQLDRLADQPKYIAQADQAIEHRRDSFRGAGVPGFVQVQRPGAAEAYYHHHFQNIIHSSFLHVSRDPNQQSSMSAELRSPALL